MDPAHNDRLLTALQKALGHELPNRLLAIQGLTRLLDMEHGSSLDGDGKEYMQRLAAAAQRTHVLIKALADLIRLVRSAELPEVLSLPEALREAVAEVKQLCSGAAFEYHFPQTGPCVRVPRLALRQVALHLLRNAAQAALPDRSLRIAVGAREVGPSAEFWVSDNGRGIAAQQQAKLFEPFSGSAAAGAGLGLFLVRHVIEAWGGVVRAESAPGQGSTFTVTLPSAPSRVEETS